MSVSGVENSGKMYSGQVRSRQTEEDKKSSEDHQIREQELKEDSRTSEPGRGESMDITA